MVAVTLGWVFIPDTLATSQVGNSAFFWMAARSVGLMSARLKGETSSLSTTDQARDRFLQLKDARVSKDVTSDVLDTLSLSYLRENLSCSILSPETPAAKDGVEVVQLVVSGTCRVKLPQSYNQELLIQITRNEKGLPELLFYLD